MAARRGRAVPAPPSPRSVRHDRARAPSGHRVDVRRRSALRCRDEASRHRGKPGGAGRLRRHHRHRELGLHALECPARRRGRGAGRDAVGRGDVHPAGPAARVPRRRRRARRDRGRRRAVLAAGLTTNRDGQRARVHRLRTRRVPCVQPTARPVGAGRGRLEPRRARHRQHAVRAARVRVLRPRTRPDPRQDGRHRTHRRRASRGATGEVLVRTGIRGSPHPQPPVAPAPGNTTGPSPGRDATEQPGPRHLSPPAV